MRIKKNYNITYHKEKLKSQPKILFSYSINEFFLFFFKKLNDFSISFHYGWTSNYKVESKHQFVEL